MEKWVQSCLRKLNDTALSKFKKDVEGGETKKTHICRLIRTENKQKESMVIHTYPFKHSQEKETLENYTSHLNADIKKSQSTRGN